MCLWSELIWKLPQVVKRKACHEVAPWASWKWWIQWFVYASLQVYWAVLIGSGMCQIHKETLKILQDLAFSWPWDSSVETLSRCLWFGVSRPADLGLISCNSRFNFCSLNVHGLDLASWIKIFKLGTVLSFVLNNVEYLCVCVVHMAAGHCYSW